MRCPQCGSSDVTISLAKGRSVSCGGCGLSLPWDPVPEATEHDSPRQRYRLEAPTAQSMEFGLAVVKTLVDEHGATVLEYDVDADGTTVLLSVPARSMIQGSHVLQGVPRARGQGRFDPRLHRR